MGPYIQVSDCKAVDNKLLKEPKPEWYLNWNPGMGLSQRFCVKIPEHTWGLPGANNKRNWKNVD